MAAKTLKTNCFMAQVVKNIVTLCACCMLGQPSGTADWCSALLDEENLAYVSSSHAELAGHANHRQKIRHTVQLKEDRDSMREELLGDFIFRETDVGTDVFGLVQGRMGVELKMVGGCLWMPSGGNSWQKVGV